MNRYELHYKVLDGNVNEIKTVIARCENIDELDDFGYSPLHWAVINKQINIVELLLDAGASVEVLSKDGLTPYDSAKDLYFVEIEHLLSIYKNGLIPVTAGNARRDFAYINPVTGEYRYFTN